MSLTLQIQLQAWQNDASLVVRWVKYDIMWIDARQNVLDAKVQSLAAILDNVANGANKSISRPSSTALK